MVSLAARFSPPSTLICPAGIRQRPSESNVSCLTVCATITFSPALQSPGCLQEPYRRQLIIRVLLNADLPCRRVTKRVGSLRATTTWLTICVPLQVPIMRPNPHSRCRYRYRTVPLWVPCFVFVGRPGHKILGRDVLGNVAGKLCQPPLTGVALLEGGRHLFLRERSGPGLSISLDCCLLATEPSPYFNSPLRL